MSYAASHAYENALSKSSRRTLVLAVNIGSFILSPP